MKYLKTYLFAIAVAALAAVSCDKTKVPEYQAAPSISNEQVFFPASVGDQIKMADGETSFIVPLQRGTANLEAIDVEIAASGEGIEYFTVPGTVSFAAQSKTAELEITVTDLDKLGRNNFYELTISIADETLTTPYGRNTVTFLAGIELPWIKFDDGILYEVPYWGEEEEKTMYYQQLSPTIRLCRITECFGHDTIAGGKEYDVQDYIWYWNTETNACYVPVQYMGYENSNGKVYFSDEPAFYNQYWAMKNGEGYGAGTYGPGAGQEQGTEAWFEFCDACRVQWAGDPFPYYDGNGTFYLADEYIAGDPSNADSYLGRYTALGDQDYFSGKNFGDYELGIEYGGMYVNPEGTAYPILNFAATKNSAKYYEKVKYIITDQDTDPLETLDAIVAGESNDIQTLTLEEGVASIQPELEPGLYTIVAVPFVAGDKNEKGESTEYKTLFAVEVDFYFPGVNATPKEVEAKAVMVAPSLAYGANAAEHGYMDYNTVTIIIMGTDIKSCSYFFTKKATFDGYVEQYGEDVLVENAYDFEAEDIADINSENGFATLFGGASNPLDPETEYACLLHFVNKYGASANITVSSKTAAAPAEVPAKANSNAVWKGVTLEGITSYAPTVFQGWGSASVKVRATKTLELKSFEER